ncbi:hypothetical protein B0H15DRAFT_851821 [Mycena belliarum]|uniref:Uncharacterized protein n=1 Tax=Mycena belliarum TaxID=1033014 RepID=A0AAD6XRP0_9AGAR|nr:hypothetical protein B0H15DRAFT_851821 [Mycena belliae]
MPHTLAVLEPYNTSSTPPRMLRREWKAVKPHLQKSTSLPALQLIPRARPRFICRACGFVNFYNIPMCVWCATQPPESSVLAFEKTIPRIRTASAPPRVFWTPNELSLRAPRQKNTSHRESAFSGHVPTSPGLPPSGTRRPTSMLAAASGASTGRPQTHKRSHSQPNALRIGHPNRPYYSAIRKQSSPPSSHAMRPRSLSPASISPGPPTPQAYHWVDSMVFDVETLEEGIPFSFVSPIDEAQYPRQTQTLSARLTRRLASPVSALHSIGHEAEMRAALAALVRSSPDPRNRTGGVLKKLRRGVKGLVRRLSNEQ